MCRRVLPLLVACVLLLCGCGDRLSAFETSSASSEDAADKGVGRDGWEVHAYAKPELSATSYRLYYPVKPSGSVTPLATTALDAETYAVDRFKDDAWLNGVFELRDAYYEEGLSETYADGVFTSYIVHDFLVGRRGDGAFDDFRLSTYWDTSMIENSFAAVGVEFYGVETAAGTQETSQDAVTQETIASFLSAYFPQDLAEVLAYGADKDGLNEDGGEIAPGCLYETVAVGDDIYALIRTVTDAGDGRINVTMQVSVESLQGVASMFDEDTDWVSVDVFEHYDGGYVSVIDDLQTLLSENTDVSFASAGSTALRSGTAFDGLFRLSAAEYRLTKPLSYAYQEIPSEEEEGGLVRTLSASFRNCPANVDNAHSPVMTVTVTDIDGRACVSVSDSVGYASGEDAEEEVLSLFRQRIEMLLGAAPSFDADAVRYCTVPFAAGDASGTVALEEDAQGVTASYAFTAIDLLSVLS